MFYLDRSTHHASAFLTTYQTHVAERAAIGISPLPLNAKQVGELIEQLKSPQAGEGDAL
ncbi:MAG: hypothetical protein HC765_16190, partial [Brachymonas sp.]|nr:hypothetical protein [Brachymonas sp.]